MVVTVKATEELPAGMVTLAGTETEGSELLREAQVPPVGAGWVVVIVPVEGLPPVTAAGEKVTPVSLYPGRTVTFPMTVVEPVAAVTATGVELPTSADVAVKVCEFEFAGTSSVAGTGNRAELLLVRVTVIPLEDAGPLSVTVPVADCSETTDAGLKESVVTTGAATGGATASPADKVEPLGRVAEMFTLATAVTASVVTLKLPLLAPAAIMRVAGTVAALVLLLVRLTFNPDAGAGPLRVTVPTELLPPVSELGLNEKDVSEAGLTVKDPLRLPVEMAAVT